MRKLMWFTIGFAVACAFCVWLLPMGGILLPILITAGLLVLCIWRKLRRLSLILIGCLVGLCWYFGFAKFYLFPAHAMDGTTIETTVTATAYSYETEYGVGVDGKFDWNGRHYKIRLYVDSAGKICPGDTITGTFKLRYTAPAACGIQHITPGRACCSWAMSGVVLKSVRRRRMRW